jgi:hypothetical protein
MNNNLIVSYLTLRKVIGILGVALAGLCVTGGIIFGTGAVEGSISAYYLTNMRDLFVGVLVAAGAFLLTYTGYDKTDNVLSSIAGVAAIGVAIFPMAYMAPGNIFGLGMPVVGILHYISAAVFFTALAYISYFQFTKGRNDTKRQQQRNLVYRVSGIVMFGSLVLVLLEGLLPFFDGGYYFILIMEAIMLLAFGASWFIKGRAILTDR